MYVRDKILMEDEKILLVVKKSKFQLFWLWVFGILFCWLLLIPTVIAIRGTVAYRCTEYVVTDRKIIDKRGWVSVVYNEMGLDRIEDITINVSFFGRIFNYADICIQGANCKNVYYINVMNAEDVRKQINKIVALKTENK